ncbi:addiction module antitoxin RelB [Fructobacillus evanidus]
MMMLIKNQQFSFHTNDKLLAKAQKIAAAEHLDMATILNSVLEKIVAQGKVPADFVDEKYNRRDKIIQSLYDEIEQGYQGYKNGRVVGIGQTFSKYGL